MDINYYENYVVNIKVSEYDINLDYPDNNEYSNSSGTGFYIDYGLILTCYHVVQNTATINVLTKDKTGSYFLNLAKLKYIFPDDDLAVIELENKNVIYSIFKYKILNQKKIYNVLTIGFPDENLNINNGIVSGYTDSKIQTDSTLNSGNSGGPLIINTNEVIGINSSYEVKSNNKYFSIPIFRFLIYYVLNKNKLKLINRKPNFLFTYQNNNQMFYDKEYGVLITEIDNKSVLNKYGIQVSDLIIKINGNKVNFDGKIQFNFYPDLIDLYDLDYWFCIDDIIDFTIIKASNKNEITIPVQAKYVEENIIDYFPEKNYIKDQKQYMFKKNGFTFVILTKFHLKNEKINDKLNVYYTDYLCKLKGLNKKFIVYLSNVNIEETKYNITEYPINKIITHINDIELLNYEIFTDIMKKDIINFKTIDNEVFKI